MTAVEDLSHVISALFSCNPEETSRPNILWSLQFNLCEFATEDCTSPANIYYGSGPNSEIDFDSYIIEVELFASTIH